MHCNLQITLWIYFMTVPVYSCLLPVHWRCFVSFQWYELLEDVWTRYLRIVWIKRNSFHQWCTWRDQNLSGVFVNKMQTAVKQNCHCDATANKKVQFLLNNAQAYWVIVISQINLDYLCYKMSSLRPKRVTITKSFHPLNLTGK